MNRKWRDGNAINLVPGTILAPAGAGRPHGRIIPGKEEFPHGTENISNVPQEPLQAQSAALLLPRAPQLAVAPHQGPDLPKEARKSPFCPSQEKFHTVVLGGVRNISEAP